MSDLQTRFNDFIKNQQLFSKDDSLILAVSGGLDSMVLAHLLIQSAYSFQMAHVNFGLRGEESDADARFVASFAEAHDLGFHLHAEDARAYAEVNQLSIQVAARNIRYNWFERLRLELDANWVLVAHHADDSVETILFNLVRGTGIKGLTGILATVNKVVRPLLFAERQELEEYAAEFNIQWREDSSNQSDKYSRNLIRHKVTPVLKDINPAFVKNILKTASSLTEIDWLAQVGLDVLKTGFVDESEPKIVIKLEPLRALPAAKTMLYYWLQPYGFNVSQVDDILASTESGKVFLSAEKRAVIHGDKLIIADFAEDPGGERLIIPPSGKIDQPPLSWNKISYSGQPIPTQEQVAWLDYQKLTFPLVLRKRQAGDWFRPLGMGGQKQKVKDYLTNAKLSLPEKEGIWLIETADRHICWVVGRRLDERFKVGSQTKEILELRMN